MYCIAVVVIVHVHGFECCWPCVAAVGSSCSFAWWGEPCCASFCARTHPHFFDIVPQPQRRDYPVFASPVIFLSNMVRILLAGCITIANFEDEDKGIVKGIVRGLRS